MSEAGLQKATILMLALGEDCASLVMRHLGPREVQKLGTSMASMGAIPHESVATALSEFITEAELNPSMGIDSDEYIRNVFTKALGNDKASALLDRILEAQDSSGIESLKWLDAASIGELIGNEHPQIIATILVHLERDQASEILGNFDEQLRNDVVLRIATLDAIQPTALRELNDVLTKLLSGNRDSKKKRSIGGIRAAAEILNFMDTTIESAVMGSLRDYDQNMAEKITDEMFIFDQITEIDDRGIQTLLREVPSETLIVALKGAGPNIREKIFKNMSQRAAEMMRDDLESKGPVRLSEVEAQQKSVLVIARRLAEEGQIMLGSKGGGDAFV